MRKLIVVGGLVLLCGTVSADIWVEPPELTRGKHLIVWNVLYVDVNLSVYQIGSETIVELEPISSGIYCGHVLDPKSDGLYVLVMLWPACLTEDDTLKIKVWDKENGGVRLSIPVETFSWGGGQ